MRVEDWKLHMCIGCSYLIANICGSLALAEPVYPHTPLDWTNPTLTIFCLLLQGVTVGGIYSKFAQWINNLKGDNEE